MFLEEVFKAITNDKIADYRKGQFAVLSFSVPPTALLHPLGMENHCRNFVKGLKYFFNLLRADHHVCLAYDRLTSWNLGWERGKEII